MLFSVPFIIEMILYLILAERIWKWRENLDILIMNWYAFIITEVERQGGEERGEKEREKI